jgi:hypothetical protein
LVAGGEEATMPGKKDQPGDNPDERNPEDGLGPEDLLPDIPADEDPPDDPAKEPAPPVVIRVGDQDYSPEELGEALLAEQEQHENLKTLHGQHTRELGDLRRAATAPSDEKPKEAPDPFEDPEGYHDYREGEQDKKRDAEREADADMRNFYGDNKDLNSDDGRFIVEGIFYRRHNEFINRNLTNREALDECAKEARQRIVRLGGKAPKNDEPRVIVEPGGGGDDPMPSDDPVAGVESFEKQLDRLRGKTHGVDQGE